jgi:hypothetical protein
MIDLPDGFVAQPAWRLDDDDGTSYELLRVYDRAGRLDEGRTFWRIERTAPDPLGPGPFHTEPRALSYARYRDGAGGRAVAFRDFSAPSAALLLDDWLAAPDARARAGVSRPTVVTG